MAHFGVSSHRHGGALVVVPEGELDIAAVGAVRDAIAGRAPGEALVIDLGALDFIDTSGIHLVVEAHQRAEEEGFALRVVRARRPVQRVFELAGLEGVLPFEDAGDA